MAIFEISQALPLHFKINTGVGSINYLKQIYANELYENIACSGREKLQGFGAPVDCNSSTNYQFIFRDGVKIPTVTIRTVAGVYVDNFAPTNVLVGSQFDTYEFTVDWSQYPCDECYKIFIYNAGTPAGSNLFLNADGGTWETAPIADMETDTGNTIARSVFLSYVGNASGHVIFGGGVPVGDGDNCREIWRSGTAHTLLPGTNYYAEFWIRGETVLDFYRGDNISFDIASYFTDATIISKYNITNFSPDVDTWHKVAVEFRTGAVLTAKLAARVNGGALGGVDWQNTASAYVDQHLLQKTDIICEAESEPIRSFDTTAAPCDYYEVNVWNDNNGHGINFDITGIILKFWIAGYLEPDTFKLQGKLYANSVRNTARLFGRNIASRKFNIDEAPLWFMRRIDFAFAFQHVTVSGNEYFSEKGLRARNVKQCDYQTADIVIFPDGYEYETFLCK